MVDGKVVIDVSVVSDTYDSDLSNNNGTAEISVNATVPHNNETVVPPAHAPQMYATGNPIAMIVLALIAMVGITLKRKH